MSDPGHIGGPVVIPNAMRVILNWTLADGKVVHNVCCGTVAGGFNPTPAIATAIHTALSTGALWTALAAFFATSTSLTSVSLLDIRSANNALVSSTSTAAPGTSASPELPDETAVVITLRTALTGPQNRGRMYIPGWATNALGAGNVVAAGAITALQNWSGQVGSAFATNNVPMAIAHPARAQYTGSTGTVHPARTAGLVPVTSLTVRDNHWDSQRRRGLK